MRTIYINSYINEEQFDAYIYMCIERIRYSCIF